MARRRGNTVNLQTQSIGTFPPAKFTLPSLRNDHVARERLVETVRENLDRSLFLVVAPAGYGKTALVVEALRAIGLPSAYCRVDLHDREPRTFMAALVLALRRTYPRFGERTLRLLEGSEESARLIPGAVAAFLEEADHALGELTLLALDDLQTIDDSPEALNVLDLLLEGLPPHLRLMVASRSMPRLELSRLAAQRQVAGISGRHLRFTPAEVAEAVQRGYGVTLTRPAAERITKRLGGWITGVILTMHAAAGIEAELPDTMPFADPEANMDSPAAVAARDEVFRYLADHVMAAEDPVSATFLYESSVLRLMTATTCDAVLERTDSAERLRQLDQAGLFLERVDAPEPTFRYHDLFREFLRERLHQLDPDRARVLHLRAADEALARGDWAEAVFHHFDAGDAIGAADLLEAVGEQAFQQGRWLPLGDVLDRLPAEMVQARPVLARLQASVLVQRGEHHRAVALFVAAADRFQQRGNAGEAARTLARLAATHRMAGAPQAAIEMARQALALAPPDDARLIAEVRRQIGGCLVILGDLAAAERELKGARAIVEAGGDRAQLGVILRTLQVCRLRAGDLAGAAQFLREAIAIFRADGNVAQLNDAEANLADLHYLRGEYAEAEVVARRVVERSAELELPWHRASALLALADVMRDTGRLEAAAATYYEGLVFAERVQVRFLIIYALGRLGGVEVRLDNREQGLALARQALARAEREGTRYERALALNDLGDVLTETGQAGPACAQLEAAIKLFVEGGNRGEEAVARLRLVRAAYLAGRFALATSAMRTFLPVAESLHADAVVLAEFARGHEFARYLIQRRVGATWLESALRRLGLDTCLNGKVRGSRHVPLERPLLPSRLEAAPKRRCVVRCLGPLEVELDGRPIGPRDWGGERVRSLFLHLAANGPSDRLTLQNHLWPDLPSPNAHVALRAALTRLRRTLYPECVSHSLGVWQLDPEVIWEVDLAAFNEHLRLAAALPAGDPERLAQLEAAVRLYRGQVLGEVDAPWAERLREGVERRLSQALRALAVESAQGGAIDAAASWYRTLLEREPYDEEAMLQLMRLLVERGDRLLARRLFRRFTRRLRADLGVDPGLRLFQLYRYLERSRARPLPR